MNRRSFLAASGAAASAQPKDRRPNVVLVVMDDFGIGQFAPHAAKVTPAMFDPGYREYLAAKNVPYSAEESIDIARRAMPTIDGLARNGVVFEQAYSSSNLCSPSRAGIFTGQSPNRFGVYNNIDFLKTGLPRGTILAEKLQRAGYATAMIGKYHVGTRDESIRQAAFRERGMTPGDLAKLPQAERQNFERHGGYVGSIIEDHHPLNYGFDYYFGYNHHECPFYDSEHIWENRTFTGVQKRYNTELFADKAIEFAKKSRGEGKPFFVEVAFHAVHGPLQPKAPDRYFERFPSKSYELSNFYAHVNAVDSAVAAIRAAMGPDEWRNTLFMFTADNGAPVSLQTPPPGNAPHRGHKGNYLLGGIRVPLLVHWPEKIRTARSVKTLASSMDLMPTALEAAGVAAPTNLDGKSLLPAATGAAPKPRHLRWAGIHARAWGYTRETTIGEFNQRREESPGAWAVTDGAFLLRFTGTTIPGLFSDLPDGAPPKLELFDLREDPGESKDIAAQLPQVVTRLKKIHEDEARTLPPPPVWRRDRWEELMRPAK